MPTIRIPLEQKNAFESPEYGTRTRFFVMVGVQEGGAGDAAQPLNPNLPFEARLFVHAAGKGSITLAAVGGHRLIEAVAARKIVAGKTVLGQDAAGQIAA